ncbi:uncharacterized protein [Aristolochia californica]|uniref:uncharacterized protein n=1 Tax=Aristolochia californica TaxID=171875 RepID=UPI0035E3976E
MGNLRWFSALAILVAALVILRGAGKQYGVDKDSIHQIFRDLSERLGFWALPLYTLVHTITLALCLPYAVFFEAGASVLFGFFPAVICVFAAKILGASLSFWIGRAIFRNSRSAIEWAQRSRYFHVLSSGVERDGWKFVLLARFSPMPSYVINYALAATKVRFLLDFLFPTIIGCLPMILQNTSLGSLASAAVASTSSSQKSQVWSYLLPLLGIASSILISLRIKKYSSQLSVAEEVKAREASAAQECNTDLLHSSQTNDMTENGGLRKRQ